MIPDSQKLTAAESEIFS